MRQGVLGNSLVDAEQLSVRQREAWEDGRRPKGRGRLPPALCAVAYVQRERLVEGRLEGDGTALTAGVHGVCEVDMCDVCLWYPTSLSNWPVLVQGWVD